jgi:hypothetical protein
MQNETLTLTEARVLIDALPKPTRNSRSVQEWLSAATEWSSKMAPGNGLDVVIQFTCDKMGRSFRLEIFSSVTAYSYPAQIFMRLEIPDSSFWSIKRRVSLRRSDFVDGEKSYNAIPAIQRNIETNLKYA